MKEKFTQMNMNEKKLNTEKCKQGLFTGVALVLE